MSRPVQAPLVPRTQVTLVHGFTQSPLSWRPVWTRLGAQFEVTAPHLPPLAPQATTAVLSKEILQAQRRGIQSSIVVGYSMGGRAALRLALDHPELVDGLILVSATAGIENGSERELRRDADFELASLIEHSGVEEFVHKWSAQDLFASLSAADADVESRLVHTSEHLADLLRNQGQGSCGSLWHRLDELKMPILVVHGTFDTKYSEISERLVEAIGTNASRIELHAGHALCWEQPEIFSRLIYGFSEEHFDHHHHVTP